MRLLLVDDHPLFLDGLKNLFTARGLDVVGLAYDGFHALDLARLLRPDVIVMDIQMPRCDGLMATRLIKAEFPDVKIVMLTLSDDDQNLYEAIRSGASGYLLKALPTDSFFDLLAGLQRGELPIAPNLAGRILDEFSRRPAQPPLGPGEVEGLTPRQVEILSLANRGLFYKEIGEALGLTERTVKYHMGEVIQRLHLRNRADVLAYARRYGIIPPD